MNAIGKILAVIPARAGSKGVSGKNLALVAGKPLLAWTIEAARQAGCLDRIVVTTDGNEIAEAALRAGAEVPFHRPPELARDETPGMDAILHAVSWLDEQQHYRPAAVMVLQPTTPLRTAADIVAGIQLLDDRRVESVVSVCEASHHPFWMKRLLPDGRLEDFLPQATVPPRRQDLPPAYALNGALYLALRAPLLAAHSFMLPNTCGYVMPAERSLDVDTRWDLELADFILSNRNLTNHAARA
jgi:N-acylneuraminate cytidylyltransferase/CMP-N,N'-diacetyllegionaminic acid synthase